MFCKVIIVFKKMRLAKCYLFSVKLHINIHVNTFVNDFSFLSLHKYIYKVENEHNFNKQIEDIIKTSSVVS